MSKRIRKISLFAKDFASFSPQILKNVLVNILKIAYSRQKNRCENSHIFSETT